MKLAGTLAAALLLGVLASPVSSGPRTPVLTLTTSPLAVHGARFAPSERVRVSAAVGPRRLARALHATASGAFTVSLATIGPYDPCSTSVTVTALGATGDRATLKRPPRECPPAD